MSKKNTVKKADLNPAMSETSLDTFTKVDLITMLKDERILSNRLRNDLSLQEYSADVNNTIIQDIINIVEKHLSEVELPRKFNWLWILMNISTVAKLLKEIVTYLKSVKHFKAN